MIYWKIIDPVVAKFRTSNVSSALTRYSMSIIRSEVAEHEFQYFMDNRNELTEKISREIGLISIKWGVAVESVLINDFNCSQELKDTLFLTAKQQRISENRIAAAQTEVQTAKLIKEASDILNKPGVINAKDIKKKLDIINNSNLIESKEDTKESIA